MPGIRTSTLSLLLAACAWGQVDYLPLQVGNQWVYRGKDQSFAASVDSSRTVNGFEYFLVKGLPGSPDVFLRGARRGTLMMLAPDGKTEQVWLNLGVEDPSPAGADACGALSRVESRDSKFTGPLGYFETAVPVSYSGGKCADAGLVSDVFLPWVGLMRRTVQSFAGPVTYDLVYAHLGEATLVAEASVSFEVAVDRAASLARLTLRNKTGAVLELPFTTGQRFDVSVKDEGGAEVWRWSSDQFFTQALGTEKISGERNWLANLPALNPGKYTVEGWLTTTGPRRYSASTAIEVAK